MKEAKRKPIPVDLRCKWERYRGLMPEEPPEMAPTEVVKRKEQLKNIKKIPAKVTFNTNERGSNRKWNRSSFSSLHETYEHPYNEQTYQTYNELQAV